MVEPNFFIIYGDLTYAKAPGYKEIMDKGIPMIEVKVFPTEKLVRIQEIKPEERHPEGYIVKKYKKIDIIKESLDSRNLMILLACDFNGEPTNLFENYDNTMRMLAENKQKENRSLVKQTKYLQNVLRLAISEPSRFNKMIRRDLEELKKIIGPTFEREQPGADEGND